MSRGHSIRIEARFESAHYLWSYRGEREPLHGHSYKVEAELARPEGDLDEDDLAIDFVHAKAELERLAKKLDYGCINDVEPFTGINPSAENIASWFHRELTAAIAETGAIVREIVVWEGPMNRARYVADDA